MVMSLMCLICLLNSLTVKVIKTGLLKKVSKKHNDMSSNNLAVVAGVKTSSGQNCKHDTEL